VRNQVREQSEYSACVEYRERIFPSIGATSSLLALVIASSFAIWAALDLMIALSFFIIGCILIALWWRSAIHQIALMEGWLKVNEARIELRHIASVTPLDEEQWRRRRGVDFNPALFHAHKFWMRRGVEITLDDARDPHPGWLVGSKKPIELANSLKGFSPN
jgi:Zn-dependent protease with chaperone function